MLIRPFVPKEWFYEYAPENNIQITEFLRSQEIYNKLIEILKPLKITRAYNHSKVTTNYETNTVYIYSRLYDVPKMFRCYDCPYCEPVRKQISVTYSELLDKYATCVDKTGHEMKFCKQVATEDNTVLASYCPRYAVMVICDVTHYVKVPFSLIRQIVDELKEYALHDLKIETFPDKTSEIKPEFIEIMVGADAELEIYDEDYDRYLRAEDYYAYSGKVGCDATGVELELRPDPSTVVEEVVQNVRELIGKIDLEYTVRAYSKSRPLGTHIHVSVHHYDSPLYIRNHIPGDLRELIAAAIGRPLQKVNALLYKPRLDYGYGNPTDIRDTEHSGIEIRAPPSYILHNPELLRIALKIVKNMFKLWFDNLNKTFWIPEVFSKKDYIQLLGLTESEAEIWVKHLSEPDENTPKKDIRELWGYKINKPPIKIIFQEHWDTETKQLLEEYIRKIIAKYNLRKKLNLHRIVLFGLRRRFNNTYPVVVGFGADREPILSFELAEALREYIKIGADSLRGYTLPSYVPRGTMGIGLPIELRDKLPKQIIYKLASIIVSLLI